MKRPNGSVSTKSQQFILKHSLLFFIGIADLPRILVQEELDSHKDTDNEVEDELATLHNDAVKTLALVHIVSKVAQPLCDDLEERLKTVTTRIKTLENLKKTLKEEME